MRTRLGALLICLLTSLSVTALAADTAPEFTDQDYARIAQLGPWPTQAPADAGNELSGKPWAERLGEQLFRDTALSGSGDIACISCHDPGKGYADNHNVALGAQRHVRNTQGLLNVGQQRWFGWDGGTDSLWAAALRPLFSEVEMDATVEGITSRLAAKPYVTHALTQSEMPMDRATLSDQQFVVFLSKAIAAYTRTLASPRTQFDQFRDAVVAGDTDIQARYPTAAQRGLKIFLGDANCTVCHTGPNFSNGEFHDIGRPFFTGVGQVDGGRYAGIKRVREDPFNLLGVLNGTENTDERRKTATVTLGQTNFGQWRTPSLRNLTFTHPYMHDGSLATLRDVVDYYADIDPTRLHAQGESILKPLTLDDAERSDLVRFLETLSEPADN